MSIPTDNVTFLGEEKLILVHDNVTTLNVEQDLYFTWKRWVTQDNNAGYLPAFSWTWGIPDAQGVMTPIFYLLNEWKMRTWEGDHTLTVRGHVYSQTGDPIFVPTLELHTIKIQLTSTASMALQDTAISQLQLVNEKLDALATHAVAQETTLTRLINNSYVHEIELAKLEDLAHQILGLSRSNFKIVNPIYKDNGVMTSVIQTFKSRADMLTGKVMKSYRMTSDYDDQGRLEQFRVIETEASVAASQPVAAPVPEPVAAPIIPDQSMSSPNQDLAS